MFWPQMLGRWCSQSSWRRSSPRASQLLATSSRNIVMLTSASNVAIKDSSPTDYLSQLIAADGRDELPCRLESFLVSEEALNAALKNDYEGFLDAQSETLQKHALELCGEPIPARTPNRPFRPTPPGTSPQRCWPTTPDNRFGNSSPRRARPQSAKPPTCSATAIWRRRRSTT